MIIKGIHIAEDVLTTKFACDYLACKGGCCYIGSPEEYEGPSVTDDEAWQLIERAKQLSKFVEKDAKPYAKDPVYHYEERPDEHFIETTPEGKCIYCSLEEKTCLLKVRDTGLSFPIPEHCELYPFHVEVENGKTTLSLQYEHGDLCAPAFVKGERDNTHAVRFGKDALVRKFGGAFYKELETHLK